MVEVVTQWNNMLMPKHIAAATTRTVPIAITLFSYESSYCKSILTARLDYAHNALMPHTIMPIIIQPVICEHQKNDTKHNMPK